MSYSLTDPWLPYWQSEAECWSGIPKSKPITNILFHKMKRIYYVTDPVEKVYRKIMNEVDMDRLFPITF